MESRKGGRSRPAPLHPSIVPTFRSGLPIRHPRPRHARSLRDGARPYDRRRVGAVRRAVADRGGVARGPATAHGDGDGRDVVPHRGRGRRRRRDHVVPQHPVPGDGARGPGAGSPGAGRRFHDVPRSDVGRADPRLHELARPDAALHRRAHERRRRHRPATGGRAAGVRPLRHRRRGARAQRLHARDRHADVRRHHVPSGPPERRRPLRRHRGFGERVARRLAHSAPRGLRPLRQPAARPAGRRRDRPDGPAHHAGGRVALGAQPERAARRDRHSTLLGGRRRGRLQYCQLVRGARAGRGIRALAGRGARRAAALRRRHDRAHRAGIRVRHRPGVLARACAAGRRPGAPAAQRRGALRARLDVPGRLHGAAVNVYFHTFGCKANQYDTELVRQAFADQGAVVVDDPAAADVAVVNSCTVTGESETKLRRFVRGLARQRQQLETVVMGCAAALDDGRIASLPAVRAVVGGADPGTVLAAAGIAAPRVDPVLLRFQANSRGWLKIQDGCDEHCTFCATTLARGANRSRSIPELVAEAKALAEHHAEIVLTGVHIGTYGRDSGLGARGSDRVPRPPSPDPRAPSLGGLLEALITAVPQVRFRLSSIEATEVDDTIACLLIEAPRNLAAHLHAPLQSGSNRALKRMGRHWYTAESYRARLEWLAERLPVFGLGADIIAGFPGETDADHRATVALVQALPFTYLHVFPFSVRPDAPAAKLAGRLPPPVIRARAAELRALGDLKAKAYRNRRTGELADGVVSGRLAGRLDVVTQDYLSVYLSTEDWDGRARFEVRIA